MGRSGQWYGSQALAVETSDRRKVIALRHLHYSYRLTGSAVLGLTNFVLPSIERRFGFSSKELGVIASANDIAALLLVVPISFYGGYGNKIKWMGGGAVFVGMINWSNGFLTGFLVPCTVVGCMVDSRLTNCLTFRFWLDPICTSPLYYWTVQTS